MWGPNSGKTIIVIKGPRKRYQYKVSDAKEAPLCCCCCLVTQLCLTLLQPHGLQPARLFCPWDFPGNNTGVDCHFLLQGIFPAQALNLRLLYRQVNSLPLSHQGGPRDNKPLYKWTVAQIRLLKSNSQLTKFNQLGVGCYIGDSC